MDQNLIDQIRRSNDIVDVLGSYIVLKKAGGNSYRGLCPFHNDSHPSLNVSQQKQIYKCFACGKAGNVITFVQEYEKLTFIEALKTLAKRAGILIPEIDKPKVVSTKRDLLLQIYKLTKEFYAENLFLHGTQVLDYLKDRQISAETAKSLELGYALNSNSGLKNYLLKAGISVDAMRESGLFGNYQGNLTDQFRDRLMFPIHNITGDVIAFGGRIITPSSDVGKYINSPGTELYTKGKELYGLFKTKYDIGKADKAIVCEGYIDFLRLYESGITNCVASLGTALTEDQIFLLGRYTQNIYMLYDGDLAGQKASVRAGLLILSKGFNPYIVSLHADDDPDSYLLVNSVESLIKKIETSKNDFRVGDNPNYPNNPSSEKNLKVGQNLIDYLAESKTLDYPIQDRIEMVIDAVRHVQMYIKMELLIQEISQAFHISISAIKQKINMNSRPQTQESRQQNDSDNNPEERFLLVLALKDKNHYNSLAHELTSDYFFNEEYKQIYKYLTSQDRTDELDEPARLLDHIDNASMREQLADLLFEDLAGMSFEDALHQVTLRKIQHDLEIMDREIIAKPSNLELFKQKAELMEQLKLISKNKVIHRIIV